MNSPDHTEMKCPRCGSENLDWLKKGALWDGRDAQGNRTSGVCHYALCLGCGTRCAWWDDQPPYVPNEEEWQVHVGHILRNRAAKANWPFTPENDTSPI